MKRVNFIAATSLFMLIFALPLFAQAVPAPTKIGIINTEAFYYEKVGVTKLLNAYAALDKEFEPRQQELVGINTRIENLAKEIQALQAQLNNPAAGRAVDANAVQTNIANKSDEGARLQVEFKRKQEDAKAAYEKREAAVIVPIKREIGTAVTEYAKQRGFDLVLDGAKMDQAGILLSIGQGMDLTEEFIKFFNAKPATTAAAKPATGTAAKPN